MHHGPCGHGADAMPSWSTFCMSVARARNTLPEALNRSAQVQGTVRSSLSGRSPSGGGSSSSEASSSLTHVASAADLYRPRCRSLGTGMGKLFPAPAAHTELCVLLSTLLSLLSSHASPWSCASIDLLGAAMRLAARIRPWLLTTLHGAPPRLPVPNASVQRHQLAGRGMRCRRSSASPFLV